MPIFSQIPSLSTDPSVGNRDSSVRLGGRVQYFAEFWPSLTQDPWVLDSVSFGTRIPFFERPSEPARLPNMVMSDELMNICDEEVKALLEKGAIEEISDSSQFFVSGLFVIPKRTGGYRPIINLKYLNKFVQPQHFKMEGISVLKELICEGDYFTKIDLKDAYLTIPVFPEDKKFLQILWRERLYQFKSLCFGLASAPWAFTKILKPVVAFLRKQGLRLIIYLDDILILNQSTEGVERDFKQVVGALEACGFW